MLIGVQDNQQGGTTIIATETADELHERLLLEQLQGKFAAQEADQYLRKIYIPVLLAGRKKLILETYYSKNFNNQETQSLTHFVVM